ncbi:hypothetical protein MOV08_05220 [Streptomyces yunnanensis]|uniref:Uncharacterized protein n=1 Tax=Streptomyces yunnanensis TaxID=156453 RepID=A0ABY8A1V3_9ACTN|nr:MULTISPECIES: hypothetical protein [Streptomyces]WEB38763.1 hypothetical protein MOV08_05220 [Streptomyces yunnanensis]
MPRFIDVQGPTPDKIHFDDDVKTTDKGTFSAQLDVESDCQPGEYTITVYEGDDPEKAKVSASTSLIVVSDATPTIDAIGDVTAGVDAKISGSSFGAGSYTGTAEKQ